MGGTPALTDEQLQEAVSLRQQHGSSAEAARALGISVTTFKGRLKVAARRGFAPGHFEHGVAPGFRMGKVTVQRGPTGEVERTWERQSPDADMQAAAMRAAAEALCEGIPRADPQPFNGAAVGHLCNVITLTDSHVGMRALREEAGEDWNLEVAEETLVGCFARLVESLPPARECIINQLGDWLHTDGLKAVTPSHGHLLDADGGFERCAKVAVRILRRVVDLALARFERVVVVLAEGNHDMAASCWLRIMFANLYENEPRVSVDTSELPFYCHQHGKVMLGFHHGHLRKPADLPLLYAASFPQVWGSTVKRYLHCGHRHHEEIKEHSGVKVVQHSTLAARDAYAARGGWLSERQARAFTYHAEYGEVGSVVVTPEMLRAA